MMPVSANARTPRLIAQVRSRVQQVSAQAVSDAQILALLDEAQRDLCIQLNDNALYALGNIQTAALTLNTEPYSLPASFLRERALKYKTIMARRWRVFELDALGGNIPELTPTEGRPFYYLWDNKLYIEAGTKTAGSYYLYYMNWPAALTTSTNPELPMEFDPLLVTFAVMRTWEQRAERTESEKLWQEYLGRCAVINSRSSSGPAFDGVPGDRRS